MAFPERRTADILLTILLFGVVCAALYGARKIVLIFILAVLFAYLIDPVVKFLQRHSLFFRNLRGPAVVEVYLGFLILIGAAGHAIAPRLASNTVKLIDGVPILLEGLSTGDITSELGAKYGWSEQQEVRARAFLARHKDDIQGLTGRVDRLLANAAQILGWLLLIPILAIFFLRDGDRMADVLIRVFFRANRQSRIRRIAGELHLMLTQYIRAQVRLCGLSFVFYSGAMLLLRFPHPFALGILGGVLEFIPAVGWITTLAVVVGVGVVNHLHWIWAALLLGVWRLIQDYYATPRIMGSHLKLHPLAAIFAVLVGAEIGGILGMYLSVPVMASLCVIWRVCSDEQHARSRHSHTDADTKLTSGLTETAAV